MTQDWHPPTHASFATSHEGAKPFDTKRLHYGDQTLWPEHCVQDTPGAGAASGPRGRSRLPHPAQGDAFGGRLLFRLRRGRRQDDTGLAALFKARGVKRVFACGLATDFCVAHRRWTRAAKVRNVVIEDACRAIDANNSLSDAWARMNAAGIRRVQSAGILQLARTPVARPRVNSR